MRYLLLGAAAVALSGCSFLGIGGNKHHDGYSANTGYYGQSSHQATTNRSNCNSGQCLARWNLEGGLGTSFVVGGNAVTGDQTNAVAGNNIRNIKMKDAYDQGWRAELGGSYALSPNRKIVAMGFVDEAESAGVQNFGTIRDLPFQAALSDYKSYGAELGLRQYFAPKRVPLVNTIRPYVEGRLGATHIDAIRLENATRGGVAAPGSNVGFYEGGWHGSAAGLVGVETPVSRYATIGLETGIRYTQGPDTDLTDLTPGRALTGSNNGASRTTIPLMLRGRYRF